jgi:hypothetical protein
MSQPGFAPVIYRLIGDTTAVFGTVSQLDKTLHEIWDGFQFVSIADIQPAVGVAVLQYTTNAGTAFIGTATQKVLSKESKTAISTGMAVDVGYLPSEILADPVKVSYAKSLGVVTASYAYGTMDAFLITVGSAARVYWTGGFIVDDE